MLINLINIFSDVVLRAVRRLHTISVQKTSFRLTWPNKAEVQVAPENFKVHGIYNVACLFCCIYSEG